MLGNPLVITTRALGRFWDKPSWVEEVGRSPRDPLSSQMEEN